MEETLHTQLNLFVVDKDEDSKRKGECTENESKHGCLELGNHGVAELEGTTTTRWEQRRDMEG